MDREERSAAIFGAWDGAISVVGFVFGLLLHHSPESAIAIGGLGGAISATVSMGTGEYEAADGAWHRRLRNAGVMGLATLVGSMVPVAPFFVFAKPTALLVGGVGCLLVATWVGYEKRKGVKGYATAYMILLGAAGVTLGIVSLIPASA